MTDESSFDTPETPHHREVHRPSGLVGRMVRLSLKELREILRDRRTIVTLVLMPLLVYPLLSITFNRFLLSYQPVTEMHFMIGIEPAEFLPQVRRQVSSGHRLVRAQQPPPPQAAPAPSLVPQVAPPSDYEAQIEWYPIAALESEVANDRLHLGIRVKSLGEPNAAGRRPLDYELIYRENSWVSKEAMTYIEKRLRAVNDAYLRRLITQFGIPSAVPATTRRTAISDLGTTSFSLATLVPLILILMTITGAVYPAIDLTAGERERGTLQTLIAAPVPRLGLLLAKYVAVLTVALLTALVNLVAMTVTLANSGLGTLLFGADGLSMLTISKVLGLTVLFAAFFSAVLLALTSFARSFKEAQAYLIPLMLLSISPGLLSLMPDVELTGTLAVVPLVNIVLLARDTLDGVASPLLSLVVVMSTGIYALAAIGLAARIFGSDAILYASQGSWSELLRRPREKQSAATVFQAAICLAVLFDAYFLLGNLATKSASGDLPLQLTYNAAVTVVVFGLLPLLAAWLYRVDLWSGFRLFRAPWPAFLAALILGCSLWPFAHELFLVGQNLGLASLDDNQIERVNKILESFGDASPWMILVGLAVVPAVCEEWFFRGYLFSAIGRMTRPWVAVVFTALIFGLFHVVTPAILATERLLPSTFLGIALGWLCYQTGSLLPGIVLHTCHNGLLLMVAIYREPLAKWGWGLNQATTHLPTSWMIAATAGTAVGLAIAWKLGGPRKDPSQPLAEIPAANAVP